MAIQFCLDSLGRSYRVYRETWHATPVAPPVACVEASTAYMSWNGATDVIGWVVFQGTTNEPSTKVGTVKSQGFETSLNISASAKYVQVAVYQDGVLLRNSTVVLIA